MKLSLLLALSSVLSRCCASAAGQQLFQVSKGAERGLLWSSIGLAVLTAFLQGLVTALAFMTESSNYWTFRFRLAKIEHWWWTIVSVLLTTSLVLNILSFLSGNISEAVSILALSTATFLTIVRYMLPAWRARHFIENRWLAWTGDSRTAIKGSDAGFCGGQSQWSRLITEVHLSDIKGTPSDWYGWQLWPAKGIPQDPTDVLKNVKAEHSNMLAIEAEERINFIYTTGIKDARQVSLLWGRGQGFRRRVSRATSSMPNGLLLSRPFTVDGFDGQGLCLAMGILGRNKGLLPKQLVFKMTKDISTHLEGFGTWEPRPSKVLRSSYVKVFEAQYGGLGEDYVAAAVELALLLMDVPYRAITAWLKAGLEHQSIKQNRIIAKANSKNQEAELKAHYESSYVSMIISLNNMDKRMDSRSGSEKLVQRPDIMCTGLLLKARGEPEPLWWNGSNLADTRQNEIAALGNEQGWKMPMAKLLGLDRWPDGFEDEPSIWGDSELPSTLEKAEDGAVVRLSPEECRFVTALRAAAPPPAKARPEPVRSFASLDSQLSDAITTVASQTSSDSVPVSGSSKAKRITSQLDDKKYDIAES